MKPRWAAAIIAVLALALPVRAHRLDEYLQATIFSLEEAKVGAFMRLVPGIAVSSEVIARIDSNGDGIISEAERQAYARQVLHDLSLSLDGVPLQPRIVSVDFPTVEEMKQGLGEIQIEFTANLKPATGSRKLIFENRHASRKSAYLVNCLVPRDHRIRILAQTRNENQSSYQLTYTQAR